MKDIAVFESVERELFLQINMQKVIQEKDIMVDVNLLMKWKH